MTGWCSPRGCGEMMRWLEDGAQCYPCGSRGGLTFLHFRLRRSVVRLPKMIDSAGMCHYSVDMRTLLRASLCFCPVLVRPHDSLTTRQFVQGNSLSHAI